MAAAAGLLKSSIGLGGALQISGALMITAALLLMSAKWKPLKNIAG